MEIACIFLLIRHITKILYLRNHGDDSGWVSADDDSEDGLDLDG